MNKKVSHLEEIGNKNSFKVPTGYFEELTDKIMSQLPEKVEEPKVVTLWQRVQPWVYMAAMFAGIALMMRIFVGSPQQTISGLNLTSSVEIEEFYQYYEDQLASNIYGDSFFWDDEYDLESLESVE